MTIVIAALVCASVDLRQIFKFGVYPENPLNRYHEDITLVVYDQVVPICNIEVKKKVSPSIDNIARKHLQQMFLYAYYFMKKNSLPHFCSILTNLTYWYGFKCEPSQEAPLKVTSKHCITTNHDLYAFLNLS